MTYESFQTLFWREFNSIKAGAEFFHVKQITVQRWLNGTVPVNPMAEKLIIIKSIGYLPNDIRWKGFRIDAERAVFLTPDGREFSPKELESFAINKDEYKQLVETYGHFDYPKVYPAKENKMPFRGGRRMKAAPWIPQKHK